MKNKAIVASVSLAALLLGGASVSARAADLAEQVKVDVDSVGLHPGMEPGMYVCAAGHLHIKGTVQNLANVPLGKIKVSGRAFDAAGNLLGTATAATKRSLLQPGEKTEINLEFLTVTGEMIEQAKRHEIRVVEAAPPKL
jgi:hypothetical protein